MNIGGGDNTRRLESITRLAGAGTFRGVMDGLVYFDSAATGSTLAMKADGLTVDAVKTHIAQSDAKFKRAAEEIELGL